MFKKIYQWHHRIGLLVSIPVLGWCISGLTHPMMAHLFKIKPAQRFVVPQPVALDTTSIALGEALEQHGITSFSNFRLVHFEKETYYQIIREGKETEYINVKNNTLLNNGDQRYAEYLARYFLGDEQHPIASLTKLNQFTFEYKFINRLLPVYKVSFDRSDGMDVYVETNSSRLGTMNNRTRKICIAIFSYLHNWNFLQGMPKLKLFLMLLFMIMAFGVAFSGLVIYGFLWKRVFPTHAVEAKNRKWHRRIGLMVAISTLGFAFSGGYHALAKANTAQVISEKAPVFSSTEVKQLPALVRKIGDRLVKNISIVSIDQVNYFQVNWMEKATETSYFKTTTLEHLGKGEERYAIYLANQYTQLPAKKIVSVTPIQAFGGEYGFINKRLPVTKIQYDTKQQHSVYVETSSGKLAATISASKRLEAFSFLMLHKYHFIDPIGKTVRDIIIVIIMIGIILVNVLGIVLWLNRPIVR
ncbi:PepSY domain-containing protein [Aureispira sp. CCB-E]|uniref:PepSY domain-containing protein n=1 Tax=Aureispira sp. CCB-E TaxID=3051121 RepID=UPI002868938B|nr:PepSY domain-containing protein [Aureispira sp. CCB-E]WMX13947.1 PepSY domain-containing protein [Aureispira sp. CCB-E]